MSFKKIATPTLAVAIIVSAFGSTGAFAQQGSQLADEDVARILDLVRADIAQQRVDLISTAMRFEPSESAAFWPSYREFEAELTDIADGRLAVIRDFAANFETMSDAKARELGEQGLALAGRRHELRQQYFARLADEISPIIATRFLQVDNQIQMILDLQLAAEIPLIQK